METPKKWRDAFLSWVEQHDLDIDLYQLGEIEWSQDCFIAGIEYALLHECTSLTRAQPDRVTAGADSEWERDAAEETGGR